jgi:predicted nucleotidyltransferase
VIDALQRELEADARIAYALVFGSTARGDSHAGSDVDIALGLETGRRLASREVGEIISRLEVATGGRPVDLVLLDEAPPPLAYRIFREGRVIVLRDPAALSDRKARAVLEYLDWKPIEAILTGGVLAAASHGR